MVYEKLANGLEIAFEYDSLDRIHKITYPNGGHADYHWADGRFSHVDRILSGGSLAYTYSQEGYNLLGQHIKASLPGDHNTIYYTFDLMGRPTSLQSRYLSQSDIVYNEVGSLISYSQKDPFGETDYAFTYDPWYHLASETGRFDRSYSYDSLGNRTAKNQSDYSVNSLNQIESAEETLYHYDKNGCLTSKSDSTAEYCFTYDALNRLTSITADREKHFFYDPFNRRIAESSQPIDDPQFAETRYLFGDENEIALFDPEKNPKQLRILLPGNSEIGATVVIEIGGVPYAPFNSIHGHISALVTLPGELAGAWHYSAYGEESARADSIFCTWRSWNKSTEELTGYVCFGRRYYDPVLGRWITPDPESFADGPNLYAYVHNKPLTFFDHYGLFTHVSLDNSSSYSRARHDWHRSEERQSGMGLNEYYWKYSIQNRYVNLKYGEPRIISLQEGLSMIGDRVDSDFKIQENANKVIVHKNGINTNPKDAMHQLYSLCQYHNCNGYLIYNPDHNRKIAESFALKKGYNTRMTHLMRDFYTELVEKNPDIHILASYHSQGGLFENNCAKLLSPEVKRHIYYFGVAPANIVPNNGCLGCFNVRSKWDGVPKFSETNWRKYPDICKTIRHPFYRPDPLSAHSFDNRIYDRYKKEVIIDFLDK